MVFAVVPDDVTIQKITGPEKRALDDYLGVERRESYLSKFLANENVPVVLGGFIAGFLGVKLAEDIIEDLESRVGKLSKEIKDGITETVNIRIQAPLITTPSGKPYRPPDVKLSDFLDYATAQLTGED
jgi:hypothetical protein